MEQNETIHILELESANTVEDWRHSTPMDQLGCINRQPCSGHGHGQWGYGHVKVVQRQLWVVGKGGHNQRDDKEGREKIHED